MGRSTPNSLAMLVIGVAILGSRGAGALTPGDRFEVRPESLPAPGATESVRNPPVVVDRLANAKPIVPAGFTVTLFAEDLGHVREILPLPDGSILVSRPGEDELTRLVDDDGDGQADRTEAFLSGLDRPYGMAQHDGALYISDVRGVWRIPYSLGDAKATARPERITSRGAFGTLGGHWTRNLAIDPAGSRIYVGIGSEGNVQEEPPPRASIIAFPIEGGERATYAAGLRNPVGLAFKPGTDELWTVVNERDGLGDGLVPDFMTRVEAGAFYGWPYAYTGKNPQPRLGERRSDLVARSVVPDLLFEAHSAPLDLAFVEGPMLPQEWTGDALVTLHGSWNRADPAGYMVARVPFGENGKPLGWYEAFMTGFRVDERVAGEAGRAAVWGRPAGIAIAADGSVFVTDDAGGTVWRVTRP